MREDHFGGCGDMLLVWLLLSSTTNCSILKGHLPKDHMDHSSSGPSVQGQEGEIIYPPALVSSWSKLPSVGQKPPYTYLDVAFTWALNIFNIPFLARMGNPQVWG